VTMSDSSIERNPVEVLADEFMARQRRGERPSVSEYVARHPELVNEIHELFPVLLDMEDARLNLAESRGALELKVTCPERLGDYRLLREIGRGGMGVVYEAEQESLGRRVALKILRSVQSTSSPVRRFECEARSAARLHHTNIVPVFGVGRQGGVHYYVMQFIPGQPLDEVLKEVRRLRRNVCAPGGMPARASVPGSEERPAAADVALTLLFGLPAAVSSPENDPLDRALLPITTLTDPADALALRMPAAPGVKASLSSSSSDVLSSSTDLTSSGRPYAHAVARIGVQVADALEYAAEQGIIHRDIKPSNILLDVYGTAWVTDFGLAKVLGQEGLTRSGDLVGTLRYMPPERFHGQADRRGDVYALGLTLYELLALEPAFDDSDRVQLIRRVTEEGPPRLTRDDASIPRDLATVVHKSMAREPADRYATAGELAADLRRFLDDRPIVARRPSMLDRALKFFRRYRSAVIAGAIGMILALATLAGSMGWIARDRTARSELTEREVTRALLESTGLGERGKWPEALQAVKRAEGFLAVGGSEQLRSRVRAQHNDVDVVLQLEEIRQPRPFKSGEQPHEQRDFDAEYAAAFRQAGIDVLALDPAAAGALIRDRPIRRELTTAVEHWVELSWRIRPKSENWKRLLAVARAADPDEWRNRLRDAFEQQDRAAAIKLAESAPAADLPVQTLELLALLLDKAHQLTLLRRAQRQHPDDYWINFKLAFGLDYEPPPLQDQREAVRFYTASLAIRPRNQHCHFYLAEALNHLGQLEEAIAEYQKAIELDPDSTWRSTPLFLNNLAWTLLTCPQTRLRDPRRGLELARRAVALAPNDGPSANTLGLALYRNGEWKAAITALEHSIGISGYSSFDGFFLAMAREKLGQSEKARTEYDRAVRWMQQVKPNDDELRLFRAEAADLLQIDG
jgi:serine/threonine protein kinase/Tfp pilus assembly protein PilF